MDQDSPISQTVSKKKRRRVFFTAFTCLIVFLCLMLSGVPELIQFNPRFGLNAVHTFGITSCENPVYQVELYCVPEKFNKMPLYVATIEMPEAYYQALSPYGTEAEKAAFRPIAFFSHEESISKDVVGDKFWVPIITDDGILFFYFLTQLSDGRIIIQLNTSDTTAAVFNSLAEKTSEETPLYLVQDIESIYGVIGDTAYFFPSWGEPAVNYIPEIYSGDHAVFVERID